MENMLCNVDSQQRDEMERLAFEKFKNVEKTIIKSLTYRKYCKIKDLTSMFYKMQPTVDSNTDPKNDDKFRNELMKEDITTAIISKQSIEQNETDAPLTNVAQNLNSNVNRLMFKSEEQKYSQCTEEFNAKEESLNSRFRKSEDPRMESLKKENLNKNKKNINQYAIKLIEEFDKLKPDFDELDDKPNIHIMNIKSEEIEPIEEYKNKICERNKHLKNKINDSKVKPALDPKENEILGNKIDEMKIGTHNELKELIQGIIIYEDYFRRFSRRLNKILEESVVFNVKHFSLINYIMNFLVHFSELQLFRLLSEAMRMLVKDILIDFLYKFKDRYPFSNSDQKGPMDVFNWIMDFMRINGFRPSKSLREEYSKSELNRKMVLPSFEILNEMIGITKEVYDKLKELYNSKGAFNYFFDSNIDIQMRVKTNKSRVMLLSVGHFNQETYQQIGAGMIVSASGFLLQGYFKDGKREYYGREFFNNGNFHEGEYMQGERNGQGVMEYTNGDKYEGQWKDGNRDGKGVYKWKDEGERNGQWKDGQLLGKGVHFWRDGRREFAEYVNGNKHGPVRFYDRDGKIYNWIYKDGIKLDS